MVDFSKYINGQKEVRYFTMAAKFDSKCSECEAEIEKGDNMTFDSKDRKAYCSACGEELKK